MNSSTTATTRLSLVTVAIVAIAALVATVSPAAADASDPSGPYMTMCHQVTSSGHEVYSRIVNTTDEDLVHRRQVDGVVQQERVVWPGTAHVHVQQVDGTDPPGTTYSSIVSDASGEQGRFFYRDYHIPHVMDRC